MQLACSACCCSCVRGGAMMMIFGGNAWLGAWTRTRSKTIYRRHHYCWCNCTRQCCSYIVHGETTCTNTQPKIVNSSPSSGKTDFLVVASREKVLYLLAFRYRARGAKARCLAILLLLGKHINLAQGEVACTAVGHHRPTTTNHAHTREQAKVRREKALKLSHAAQGSSTPDCATRTCADICFDLRERLFWQFLVSYFNKRRTSKWVKMDTFSYKWNGFSFIWIYAEKRVPFGNGARASLSI